MVDHKTSNLATIYWLYCFCVQQKTKLVKCAQKYAKQHTEDVYDTEYEVSDRWADVCNRIQS